MLIVTRKQDEEVVIEGRITVRVVEIRGNRIRLGIEAPSDAKILRQELLTTAPSPEVSPGEFAGNVPAAAPRLEIPGAA